MSFGASVFVGRFNQKTVKGDQFIKVNHVFPRWYRLGKTLEHSRRQPTMTEHERMTCGAGRPHLQTGRSMGPTVQCLLRMMVLHRLKDRIYTIYSSRFDPRVQN